MIPSKLKRTSSHPSPSRSKDVAVDSDDEVEMLPDPVIVRRTDFTPRNMGEFLVNYPDDRDNPRINANVQFYAGEIAFRPYGLGIDEFHERAWGDYRLLEEHHGYN